MAGTPADIPPPQPHGRLLQGRVGTSPACGALSLFGQMKFKTKPKATYLPLSPLAKAVALSLIQIYKMGPFAF